MKGQSRLHGLHAASRFGKGRIVLVGMFLLGLALSLTFANVPALQAAGPASRYVVVAKSAAEYDALKQDVQKSGATILNELREVGAFVVSVPGGTNAPTHVSAHASAIVPDHVTRLIQPDGQNALLSADLAGKQTGLTLPAAPQKAVTPDPAYQLDGLLWNVYRIHGPQAWPINMGEPGVRVGVADTGLDYTHSELKGQVSSVVDFTVNEDPPLCKTFFGTSDQELSAMFGGPANGDWNGHGSWIGGNIAAALDGQGINGIAPKIKLVALKISQWCGSAYDSTILDAFLYAANHEIDVVSISFGGYLDRTDPNQDVIYQLYVAVVAYARSRGTVIAASAGNEHVRIGDAGQVVSHGPLNTPGAPFGDLYGMWQNPAGIPGVVDVSSTGNVVAAPSATCPAGTTGSTATCKPLSDPHQSFGIGKKDQLAYYSNYGPRIDVAGPGGARKFNLPVWDRGGTPGWPYTTDDKFMDFEDFSITSNWATQIPCFTITGGGFPANQCYSTIQGTSMATPHASGVLALIASRFPGLRNKPAQLIQVLKNKAQHNLSNTTPPLSATDTSAADLTGVPCPTGYCHLGGASIPNIEAYGAGLVDAYNSIK